jgi:hypothetical protein
LPTTPIGTPHRRRQCRSLRIGAICGSLLAMSLTMFAQADTAKDCHALEEPTTRLACYDRATARPESEISSRAAAPASGTAGSAPAAPANPASTVTQRQAPAQPEPSAAEPAIVSDNQPSPRGRRATAPLEAPLLNARIAEVRTTSIGRRQFLLENGELWEQLETGRATLRSGDVVDVRPTLFGAWQMRDSEGRQRAVKVRRAN